MSHQLAPNQIKVQGTRVFWANVLCKKRIRVNEGGSRSSKTHSLAQIMVKELQEHRTDKEEFVITVVRKTLPALKTTAMKDVIGVLKTWGAYRKEQHNKTDGTYTMGNAVIEFVSIDDAQKIRGRKRNILWCNEANELEYEDFKQLLMRTAGDVYLDYNPSDMFSWIYDYVLTRDDVEVIHSTFVDNPFNPPEVVKEIMRYKDADENYWRIYGLGLRGISEVSIFTHWKYCDELPESGDKIFGLDFGFKHPLALTELRLYEDAVYTKEHIYETDLTDEMLISRLDALVESGVLTKDNKIYADSEDPKAIKKLQEAGYNVEPALKGQGSVLSGIRLLKSKPLYVTKSSVNGAKELKSYSWKTKDGKPIDEPVKINDHFCDSVRMAVFSYDNQVVPGFFI